MFTSAPGAPYRLDAFMQVDLGELLERELSPVALAYMTFTADELPQPNHASVEPEPISALACHFSCGPGRR